MTEDSNANHDRQVAAVTKAVSKLTANLAGMDITPEAVFEGAVRGGAVALISARNMDQHEIADLLETFAEALRNVDGPNLRVVN